jgi:hypothetical protein
VNEDGRALFHQLDNLHRSRQDALGVGECT